MKTPKYNIPVAWARSMVPPAGVDAVPFGIHDMPTLRMYRRPRWHFAALALWATLAACGLGYVVGKLVPRGATIIATPLCRPNIDEGCP